MEASSFLELVLVSETTTLAAFDVRKRGWVFCLATLSVAKII